MPWSEIIFSNGMIYILRKEIFKKILRNGNYMLGQ